MATKWPNELSTRFLDGVIQERPTKEALRKTYVASTFFPMRPVADYELTWDVIQSANHIAGMYAMDGTPIPGDDPSFYERMANVLNIAASRKLEESTVMTFREPGEVSLKSRIVQNKREKALRMLRNKIAACDDEVDTLVEYMCAQCLLGTFTWPPTTDAGAAISPAPAYWGNTAGFTLDMEFRSAFVQDIASLSGYDSRAGGGQNWQHASADPFLDLEVIRELITETAHINAYGSTLIMSSSALSWMSTRPNAIRWFANNAATGAPAPDETARGFIDYMSLQNYIKTNLGYNIVLYDSVWTYETGIGSESGQTENHVHFLPRNKMIVIPPGALSRDNAFFATAPISGPDDAYRTGKQTWSNKMDVPPWSWEVGVQLKGFPILRTTKEIAVFTLW